MLVRRSFLVQFCLCPCRLPSWPFVRSVGSPRSACTASASFPLVFSYLVATLAAASTCYCYDWLSFRLRLNVGSSLPYLVSNIATLSLGALLLEVLALGFPMQLLSQLTANTQDSSEGMYRCVANIPAALAGV